MYKFNEAIKYSLCVNFLLIVTLKVSSTEPIIVSDESFGTVQSGEIVYVTSTLTNQSEHDIEIFNARTSCGCFKLLDTPTLCKAGESLYFPIRFDTVKRAGSTTQTLEISSSEGDFQANISGNVLEDLKSAPSTLLFNNNNVDEQIQHFYIWSHTEKFDIKSIQYNPLFFDLLVNLEDPESVDNKKHNIIRSYDIAVRLKNLLTKSPTKEKIIVDLDSNTRSAVVVEVDIQKHDVPLIKPKPANWVVNLKELPKVFVLELENENIKIDRIDLPIDYLQLTLAKNPLSTKEMLVTLDQLNTKEPDPRKLSQSTVHVHAGPETVNIPLIILNQDG